MANGSKITLNEGSNLTEAFRNAYPNQVKAELFDKDLIEDIIDQQGCTGLRIYNGLDNGDMVSVLVGVDSNGNDMTNGVIIERGTKCPRICSQDNELNS
jgi:hypothetical protein